MANETRLRQNFLGGLIENNPLTTIGTTLNSISLSSCQPVTSTGHMAIILDPDGQFGEPEVAWIINHGTTSQSATLLRGQEGTLAREHRRDTPWVHGPTQRDWQALDNLAPSLPPRTAASFTTNSLDVGSRQVGLITLALGYRLYRIATSAPARVRLYTTTAAQDADLARLVGTDPGINSGLVLDYGTTPEVLDAALSPLVDGFDGDQPPNAQIAITVDNIGAAPAAITVTLTYVRTE